MASERFRATGAPFSSVHAMTVPVDPLPRSLTYCQFAGMSMGFPWGRSTRWNPRASGGSAGSEGGAAGSEGACLF